jgi:hypothetical protein
VRFKTRPKGSAGKRCGTLRPKGGSQVFASGGSFMGKFMAWTYGPGDKPKEVKIIDSKEFDTREEAVKWAESTGSHLWGVTEEDDDAPAPPG